MGKKKHQDKDGDKHRSDKQDRPREGEPGRTGPFSMPLAGIAAMVTHQLQSPAARAAMASGLRAAADALSKSSTPPTRPQPPTPPQPAAAPVPPADPVAPQGTTRQPNPDAIAGAIGEAADLVLARLFGPKKQ